MAKPEKEEKERRREPSAADIRNGVGDGGDGGGGGGGGGSTVNVTPSQVFATSSVRSNGYMIKPKFGEITFSSKLITLVFFVHLIAVESMIIFLAIHAYVDGEEVDRNFHVKNWYGSLLTSIAFSVTFALGWLIAMLCQPLRTLKVSLWLAPMLLFVIGVLLMDTDTGVGLAFASIAIVVAIFQLLYACWVIPRLTYAGKILSASLSTISISFEQIKLVTIALILGLLFSISWVVGVSGVATKPPHLTPLYVFSLLVSLAWTCHVIRNVIHVTISRAAYRRLVIHPELIGHVKTSTSFGTIVLASALSPLVVVVRGTARAMRIVAGEADEFLFSCASCCMGLSNGLILHVNRWALVHIGAYGSGLLEASQEVWGSFDEVGMVGLVDSDLTSSVCFFAGVAGGAACSLVGAIWMLVVDKGHVTAIAVYTFIVGYFMVRIAMAWPQGCVSAYLVAYAEDPRNPLFGSTISNRIRELRFP